MSSPPLMWRLSRHCNWYQMWNGFFEEFRLSLEMKTLTFQINCTYVGGNTLSWSFGQYLQNSRAKSLMHVKFHSIWPVALHSERSGDLLLMIPWKFIRFLLTNVAKAVNCLQRVRWVGCSTSGVVDIPIYYYRGWVLDDNHAKNCFHCWLIVIDV